jgi:hypothetical protein
MDERVKDEIKIYGDEMYFGHEGEVWCWDGKDLRKIDGNRVTRGESE